MKSGGSEETICTSQSRSVVPRGCLQLWLSCPGKPEEGTKRTGRGGQGENKDSRKESPAGILPGTLCALKTNAPGLSPCQHLGL
jgi:hypothetical protein